MPDSTYPRAATNTSAAPIVPAEAFRDRVVRAAVTEGLISREDIAAAWANFKRDGAFRSARFWRLLAEHRGAGREALYALAARVYGFNEVGISVSDVIAFVREVTGKFSGEDWARMSELRIIPTGYDRSDASRERIVFVCSDPMRIEVNNFLSSLTARSFTLCYAPSASVDYVLDRVLPVLFSNARSHGKGRIFGPAVRLVPLDPLRDVMQERGTYRRAA